MSAAGKAPACVIPAPPPNPEHTEGSFSFLPGCGPQDSNVHGVLRALWGGMLTLAQRPTASVRFLLRLKDTDVCLD